MHRNIILARIIYNLLYTRRVGPRKVSKVELTLSAGAVPDQASESPPSRGRSRDSPSSAELIPQLLCLSVRTGRSKSYGHYDPDLDKRCRRCKTSIRGGDRIDKLTTFRFIRENSDNRGGIYHDHDGIPS